MAVRLTNHLLCKCYIVIDIAVFQQTEILKYHSDVSPEFRDLLSADLPKLFPCNGNTSFRWFEFF